MDFNCIPFNSLTTFNPIEMGGGSSRKGALEKADTSKEQQNLEVSLKSKISGHIKPGDWNEVYERKQDLGSGMSGVVFLVSLKSDPNQTFACKTIEKHRMRDDEVQDLREEIALCASLDHPNIVKIVESFESDKAITMIMECCRGGELYDSLIEEGEYTQQRAAELFTMMVQAVNYCHQVGVVHRDLKLENFVFESKPTERSVLKLIDFGLSVKHRGSGIKKMKSVVGTAYYMAPEVLDAKVDYDNKCDVWALGVILFMMLTGTPPFNGSNERQIMQRAARGEVDWSLWHHGIEFNGAKDLISRMLVPASRRYDCQQVLKHKWLATANSHPDAKISQSVVGALNAFSKRGKLYRSSAQIIAVKLSASEVNDLRQQFQLVDADGSGTISLTEFKKALVDSSEKVSDAEIEAIFQSIDLDGTGLISYSEFLSATLSTTNKLTKERLNDAFDALDPDGSGFIDTSELKGLLSAFVDDVGIEKILESVDADNSNTISREEFLALCMDNAATVRVSDALHEHLSGEGDSAAGEGGASKAVGSDDSSAAETKKEE